MQELLLNEIVKIKNDHDIARTNLWVRVILLLRLVKFGINFLVTRFYLRKCNSLGKIVFTKGWPKIINKGHIQIGNLVRIWSSVNRVRLSVTKGGRLEIGNNTRINGSTISVQNSVRIGNDCRIAPHVIIMDGDFHDVNDRLANGKSSAITIKDHAWVSTRAMILKGVTIGEGAVVAAGSVVTKDVADYTMAGGVPAKFIKKLR